MKVPILQLTPNNLPDYALQPEPGPVSMFWTHFLAQEPLALFAMNLADGVQVLN